ncbi:MAG: TetR/AcrR family transcriptional regulator [Bacillus subtilis]|nr:TetR/AcrR family transcriptional regulator [Bacillus subtilis]
MTKKEETKVRILTAALTEFGVNGYEQASTNQIAEDAGVSKGLVFKYFENKASLYYALFVSELERMLEAMSTYLLEHRVSDPFEKIVDVIIWKASYALNHPQATAVLLEAIAKPLCRFKRRLFHTCRR